jgi:uncharacterized protein YkwD
MIKRNRQGKLQVSGFHVHFLKIDFYKLFLNLLVLALFGFIIWSAIKLFSGEFLHNPLTGSLVFFVEIAAFVLLSRHTRANRWRPPSIVVTALVIIAMLIVMAFAGVQPISGYKDKFASNVSEFLKSSSNQSGITSTIPDIENAQEDTQYEDKNINQNNIVIDDKAAKIEQEVLALVNGIRANKGTPVLVWDDELYIHSKNHTREMAERKQLFHTDVGMPYAENCWGGEGTTWWDANTIVDSWMNSDFHRTWLLCPNLKHIAVGVVISDTGMYASWTFWVSETNYYTDWWYSNGTNKPPSWWY